MDKPDLGSITWSHFILDFLKLFVDNMQLRISLAGIQIPYFLDVQIKHYGKTKTLGEVWARQACAGANQQRLTTCAKKGGQEEARGEFRALVQERLVTSDGLLSMALSLTDHGLGLPPPSFFQYFKLFNILYFWHYEEVWRWAWYFGRTHVQHSHFLNLVPILRNTKSSIPHGAWRFHVIPKKFLKLDYTKTFIFTIGIFFK